MTTEELRDLHAKCVEFAEKGENLPEAAIYFDN
jgi:hypothetical protein